MLNARAVQTSQCSVTSPKWVCFHINASVFTRYDCLIFSPMSLLKLRQSTKTSVSQAMVVAVLYSPFKTGILWQITLMPASWDYLRSLIYTCDLQLGGSRDTQPWFRNVFCCVIVFLAILCLNEPWLPVPHMSLLLFLVTCTYIPKVKVYIKPFLYHLASFIGVAL